MKLTPLDIRHKEFKRGMRGYADVEVDEFLDEVADEYERLFKENIDLRDRVEALEEKVAGYQRIEETLQKTLVNAQASAEEQKQNANKQAQLVLQDAEMKARQMVNEAYSERQSVEQAMAKLKSGEEDFRFKFRQMLEGYLRQLGDAPEIQEAPATPAADFSRHAEAIKEAIARESTPEPAAKTAAAATAAPAAEPPAQPASPLGALEEPHVVPPRPVPEAPAVAPARGPGGVQAGAPRQETAPRRPVAPAPDPEVTLTHPAGAAGAAPNAPAAPPPQPAGASPAEPGADSPPVKRERIQFGEDDDLLADVDGGVNENEFKW
jgi:cell division initiation protein